MWKKLVGISVWPFCHTKPLVEISHYMVGMGLEHGCKVATTLEIVKDHLEMWLEGVALNSLQRQQNWSMNVCILHFRLAGQQVILSESTRRLLSASERILS